MERYGRIKKTFLISMRKGAVSLQKPQLGKYKYIQVYIDWSKPQLDNMLSVHHVSLCTNRGSFFTPLLALVSDHVWHHCSPTPSCIGIKRKQEVYANLCASRLNDMPMQPLQAKQQCRTCSLQRCMGHMREHALRGGQNPCQEEKGAYVHIAASGWLHQERY